MQLGVSLHPLGANADGNLILETARNAERLGFEYIIIGSHVMRSGPILDIDPIVLLSTIAGATSRIRLATSVLVLPYYNPVVLAHQAASLDVLSNGRFVLGVGTGWDANEFAALEVPLAERGARTEEHLAVMQALWTQDPAHFAGRFTTFRQATLGITPRTAGGPPVWVGGQSDAALRRALRFASGWHGAGVDAVGVAEVRSRLAALSGQVGRNAATLELTSVCFLTPPGFEQVLDAPGAPLGGPQATAESVVRELRLLAEAGISMCALWMPIAPTRMAEALEWIASELMPQLADSGR